MKQPRLSVVIPTLNEAKNIRPLLSRLSRTLDEADIVWEALFVDDHSSDNTVALLEQAQAEFPLRVFMKQGKRGKAYSLLEGFGYATYEYTAILDADMQYPPEAIPEMVKKLERGGVDIVVANREVRETTLLRQFLSRSFNFFFAQFLHGLDVDVQAGLKVFRRKILREVVLDPTPWTFDLEFLLSARNYGYVIGSVPITFAERQAGESKIKFLRAMYEIGWNALLLRFKGRPPLLLSPENTQSMIGAGVAHGRQRFITHTTLHHHFSALNTFAPWQRNFILGVIGSILLGLFLIPLQTGIAIIALLSTVYFVDTFFNLGLVLKSLKTPPEIESTDEELRALNDKKLPIYSILCPLYKEAHMLPGFVRAISALEWPKAKLDVLLLLEENDPETVAAAQAMDLPEFIRIVVVPHSMPKTKPKACNYGLSIARGEYIVIYDAEDEPDPWQLRKAYLGFEKAGSQVKCLQAKLNYFNPHQNLLTRFFTAEYSLWFDIILVGLQSINTSIPLGGTSNHFRTADLLELEGWDPFNVTEDCDLGVRIFKRGFRTAVIDSVTLEEANSKPWSWLKQRSRWIKGYMQTYLVHMRHPLQFLRENGVHALLFQLVVGGKIAFLFINPILWVTTIAYFTLYTFVGPTIQLLYPQWVFYMAAISLVFGNFLYIYYYMIGCAKRQHWPLIKYVLFIPIYWVMGSTAAYIALYELIVRPHYWQKTTHGLQHVKSKWVDSLIPETLVMGATVPISWFQTRWSQGVGSLKEIWKVLEQSGRSMALILHKTVSRFWKLRESGVLFLQSAFRRSQATKQVLVKSIGAEIQTGKKPAVLTARRAMAIAESLKEKRQAWVSMLYFVQAFGGTITSSLRRIQKTLLSLRRRVMAVPQAIARILKGAGAKTIQSFATAWEIMSGWIKKLLPEPLYAFLFSSKGFFMIALVLSNFINFLFNAFLGRVLSFEELSLVTLMNTLWFLAIVVVSAFSSTVNHRVAYLGGAKSYGKIHTFFRSSLFAAVGIALGVSGVWILLNSWMTQFFHVADFSTLLFFTPVFTFGVLTAGFRGLLQGLSHFGAVAVLFVAEALVKFVLAIIFVSSGHAELVYLAIPLSIVVTAGLSFVAVRVLTHRKLTKAKREIQESFPKSFFSATLIFNLSVTAFLSVDIFLVNHYLSPIEAGRYALLALIGKMIYFFGSLPNAFTITLVSRQEGLRLKTNTIFLLIYGLVFFAVALGVLVFGVFGAYAAPLLFGEKARTLIPWLLPYTIALGLFTLTGVLVSYHLAKRHYLFSVVSLALSCILVGGLMKFHNSINDIVGVVLTVSIVGWVAIQFLDIFYRELRFVRRGLRDLVGVFYNGLPKDIPDVLPGKKKILIFNWRDTKHVFAGGAEVYVHEIAKGWVKEGNHVTLFCGNDGHEKRHETLDGIQVIRRGGFYLVYVWAFLYYIFRFRGKYDVVIDCENGIPFFTPIYVRKPIFCLLHHVHQEVFYYSLPRPLAWFASFLEKDLMTLFYKRVKFITVSESSKKEMRSIGIGSAGIRVVNPGVHLAEYSELLVEKSIRPTILYLGRLKAYKSVDVLIRAFRQLLSERPDAELIIAGDGEERDSLERLARKLHLNDRQIRFIGHVSHEEKLRLLQSAWVFVNPSFREGWGIVNIEANASGTVVVASDVPGLRDSVKHAETGYLVKYGDTKAFAEKIMDVIRSRELREEMATGAREWAGNFDWQVTSKNFYTAISHGQD